MRNTNRKSHRRDAVQTPDPEPVDSRPGRIHGATITSWAGPPEVDLAAFFARSLDRDTITGSGTRPIEPVAEAQPATVSLSDGTKITFATAGQFTVMDII